MIKPKHLPLKLFLVVESILEIILKRKVNKIQIDKCEIRNDCSYIFMFNHFSFLDGFVAQNLIRNILHNDKKKLKKLSVMVLEDQLLKNKWMRMLGGFSINPKNTNSLLETIKYTTQHLSTNGNTLMLFPQGRIESNHVDYIDIRPGINLITKKTHSRCQLIWVSMIIDYYESTKPSFYCSMLDCGWAEEFNLDEFKIKINQHHQNAIKKQIRIPNSQD